MECDIRTWPDEKGTRRNPIDGHTWVQFGLRGDLLEWIYSNTESGDFESYTHNPTDLAGKQALEPYKAVARETFNRARAQREGLPREADVTVFGVEFLFPDDKASLWVELFEQAVNTDEVRNLVAQLFETLTSLETALDTGS